MENNFDDYEDDFDLEEFESELISSLDYNGIISTFEMIKSATSTVNYWKKYKQDRKRENIENQDGTSKSIDSIITEALEKAFNSRTEELDMEEEEKMAFHASYMKKILTTAYNSSNFINSVEEHLSQMEYDSEDIESRSTMVATLLSIQQIIPITEQNSEITDKWKKIKEIIAEKIEALSTVDYEVLYTSTNDQRSFFAEPIYSRAHTSQILKMPEDNFCKLLYRTQDGMHGNSKAIETAISMKKILSNSKFVNYFYDRHYSYAPINLDAIDSLTNQEKIENIRDLRRSILSKYNVNSFYSEYLEYSDDEIKEHQNSINNLLISKEFNMYLDLLSKMSDEQFTLYMFDNLSSSSLSSLYGREKEIIQNRLKKLSRANLLAISKHYTNSSRPEVIEALEQYKNQPMDEKTEKRAQALYDMYSKISSPYLYQSYSKFEVPSLENYPITGEYDNNPLVNAFNNSLKINNINTNIIQAIRFIHELKDTDFIKFATRYNQEHSLEDAYIEDSYSYPETIEEIQGNSINCITKFFEQRIFLLPTNLKLHLLKMQSSTTGVLTPTIVLTSTNGVEELRKAQNPSKPEGPNTDAPSI